mgnify:CR=1 FL=1
MKGPGVGYGDKITGADSGYDAPARIARGKYNSIKLSIFDQNHQPVQILDPDMLIIISIHRQLEED